MTAVQVVRLDPPRDTDPLWLVDRVAQLEARVAELEARLALPEPWMAR